MEPLVVVAVVVVGEVVMLVVEECECEWRV